MNYCKHLKKRKNKPFCKLTNEEIPFRRCQQCGNKEYKIKNLHSSALKQEKMHNKSKKLTKLEKNRKSVFTEDLEHCYLCGRKKEDLHEIYAGRNRINSIKYNFVLPLCRECHSLNQNNVFFNDYWHKQGQLYWEKNIGSREEFIKIFRKNYL